jgi:hypothetical protein
MSSVRLEVHAIARASVVQTLSEVTVATELDLSVVI